jgi:methyltransferase (TIGR00027 family)
VQVSRTAQYVALFRALETGEQRRPPLFRDPLATRFLSPGLRLAVRAAGVGPLRRLIEGYADLRGPGARTSAIGRTRLIDELTERVLAEGIRQVVILGAGFDCRAHRLPALRSATVYEVDRAATQAEKRARLRGAGGDAGHVRYVSVDFLRDDLGERLRAAGWRADGATFFIWEGVSNYLTEEAVAGVLSLVGGAAPGSALAFTYIHKGAIDGSAPFHGAERLRESVRRLGEPWTFGMVPAEVPAHLARFGLRLEEDVGADEYRERYGVSSAGYAFYRVAFARRQGPRAATP